MPGAQGEKDNVAAALQDHYKPVGPSDRVPEELTSAAVALADKLDMLTGFWAIDEKPPDRKIHLPCAVPHSASSAFVWKTSSTSLWTNCWPSI